MADKQEKNSGHRWQEGHPRYGGRKKRTAQAARDLAEELGVDPLAFMLQILSSDVIEQTIIENGKAKKIKVAVDLATRIDAAKSLAPYLYPRLSAQQVTGRDDGPIEVDVDVSALLADPEMMRAAQQLSLALAKQASDQWREERSLPEPESLPGVVSKPPAP